jgi:hypothetical protein
MEIDFMKFASQWHLRSLSLLLMGLEKQLADIFSQDESRAVTQFLKNVAQRPSRQTALSNEMGELKDDIDNPKEKVQFGMIKIKRLLSIEEFISREPDEYKLASGTYSNLGYTRIANNSEFSFSDFIELTKPTLKLIEELVFLHRGRLSNRHALLLWNQRKWFILFHAWSMCVNQIDPFYQGVETILNFAGHVVAFDKNLHATVVYSPT